MPLDVLLGLQWGDEGKGKIIDLLAPDYDVVCRFQGGPNAGHSIEYDNHQFVLHTIPSGIFRKNTINVIGNGVVVDPITLKQEVDSLKKFHINVPDKLFISEKAHLILPTHRALDRASEAYKDKEKIGSTLRGITPAYIDKIGRQGLRVGDIKQDFKQKYQRLKSQHLAVLEKFYNEKNLPPGIEEAWWESIDFLQTLTVINSEHFLSEQLKLNNNVLAEGAQGALLDIDFGTYPYVTSSNTTTSGVLSGLGVSPSHIRKVLGVFKAYCTRVGNGPFPTELFNNEAETLKNLGNEVGATTGRNRRCGWLDLVALSYAIRICGVTDLVMTKADVLSDIPQINVGSSYTIGEEKTRIFPFDCSRASPNYKSFKSWKADLSTLTKETEFPEEFVEFISFIEKRVSVPIKVISIGPKRHQSIFRNIFYS